MVITSLEMHHMLLVAHQMKWPRLDVFLVAKALNIKMLNNRHFQLLTKTEVTNARCCCRIQEDTTTLHSQEEVRESYYNKIIHKASDQLSMSDILVYTHV